MGDDFQEYEHTVLARQLDVRTQINTPEGMQVGEVGDYIVVGEANQRTIVKQDDFEATHRPKGKQRAAKKNSSRGGKDAGKRGTVQRGSNEERSEEASGNFRSL